MDNDDLDMIKVAIQDAHVLMQFFGFVEKGVILPKSTSEEAKDDIRARVEHVLRYLA